MEQARSMLVVIGIGKPTVPLRFELVQTSGTYPHALETLTEPFLSGVIDHGCSVALGSTMCERWCQAMAWRRNSRLESGIQT